MNVQRILELNPELHFDVVEYLRSVTFADRLDARWASFLSLMSGDRSGAVPEPDAGTPVSNGADLPELNELPVAPGSRLYEKKSTGTTGPRKTIYYSEGFYFDELFLPVRKVARLWGLDLNRDGVSTASLSNGRAWEHLLLADPGGTTGAMARLKIDERSDSSMASVIRILDRLRPLVIFAKPAVLTALALCSLRRDRRTTPRPALVISSGGTLTPDRRSLIEDAFSCRVGEVYGTSEAGCVAFACPGGAAYHPDDSQVFVECGSLEPGRLLVTMTANEVMPIRRFDTGDTAAWKGGRCSCGLPGPQFLSLHGKGSEILDFGARQFFDLGRVNLAVLPGASAYSVRADPTVIEVTVRLPERGAVDPKALIEMAAATIRGLLPAGLRHPPEVVVRVELGPAHPAEAVAAESAS